MLICLSLVSTTANPVGVPFGTWFGSNSTTVFSMDSPIWVDHCRASISVPGLRASYSSRPNWSVVPATEATHPHQYGPSCDRPADSAPIRSGTVPVLSTAQSPGPTRVSQAAAVVAPGGAGSERGPVTISCPPNTPPMTAASEIKSKGIFSPVYDQPEVASASGYR